ncbi:LysR family transcriptional regulator [Ferrimonas sp. SCSIO 43195]|uniref:LysR family transcriptional regulator n=1 Tax=Ferrimonas sp. SCSIO 43195 TaxID=2822844 RepID=UPI002075BA4E|nr:LysR family transcriptional regulator [Ferrimonas sp. SCSIO 43195]USD35807.1 LysR family transcriptional regulator [Ferrimonas sp. SCSIO 43195]
MKALQDLTLFMKTAQLGSLSAAARQLALTPAAVSAAVKRLETELNTVLFVRSTRSLRLTPEGERFLIQCQHGVEVLEAAAAELQSEAHGLSGLMQLSMPSGLGRNRLLPLLDQFQREHPKLQVRIQMTDRLANVYAQPVDLALRYGIPEDSSLVALPVVKQNRRVLCASPEYLRRHGQPQSLEQLADRNCLCFMLGESHYDRWRFWQQGQLREIKVSGNRSSDDGDVVHRWALMGAGIAYKSRLDVAEDLRAGRLLEIAGPWLGEPAPLNLVCPDRRRLSPAVRQLHQWLIDGLGDQPQSGEDSVLLGV